MDYHEKDLDRECNLNLLIPESLKIDENSDQTQNRPIQNAVEVRDTDQVHPNQDSENLLPLGLGLVKESCRPGPNNNVETYKNRREAVFKRYNTLSNVFLGSAHESDEEFDSDSDSEDVGSDSDSDLSDKKSVETDEEVREHKKYLEKFKDLSAPKKHQFDINAIHVTGAESVDHNDASVHFDTQECKPSTSAFLDEPSTSGEGRGSPAVNEANVIKCLEANQKLLNYLITMEATFTNELQSVRTKYNVITKRIKTALAKKTEGLKWGCLFDVIHRLGMPYMKDEKYFPAPYNDDYYLKKSRGEYMNHNYDSQPCQQWSRKQRDTLRDAVMRSEMEALVQKTNQEKKLLELRIEGSDDPEEIETLKVELENVKHRNVDDLKLKDVVGTRERPYDWLRISATDLNGQWTPDECQRMWENYLSPNVNKRKWTEEENVKLLELVGERGAEDWTGIAAELGTGRSAFVCCSHYQCNLNPRMHNKRFSKMEDNQLRYQVENTRVGPSVRWSKIEFLMAGRNRYQLMGRWDRIKPEIVRGKFTEEEDLKMLSSAQRHNFDFSQVSREFPGRSRNTIYSRFLNLTGDWNRGNWSREEDQLIVRLAKRYGESRWKKFERHFKDRNKFQIRYRYMAIKSHMADQDSNETADSLCEDELPVVKTRCMKKKAKAMRQRHKKLEAKLTKMSSASGSKKRERKKNAVFDPGFAEYFKPSYQCRQSLGRRRLCPYPLDKVKVHAETFRSLCVLFSAELKIPKEDDEIMSEVSLPPLIKQILVYLRDHPAEPETLVNELVDEHNCTGTETSDSYNDVMPAEDIDLPEDEDRDRVFTFNSEDILPVPSGRFCLSYSDLLKRHSSEKKKPVGIPQSKKKAPVRKTLPTKTKKKIPPPVVVPETTPVTIATFTLQANSTELILDSCDPAFTSDILPPANSSQPVTVAVPVTRPVRKLAGMLTAATAVRLAPKPSDGSNGVESVPSTSKAPLPNTAPSTISTQNAGSSTRPAPSGIGKSKRAISSDATVTNSNVINNSSTPPTQASNKTKPSKPAAPKEKTSASAAPQDYFVRKLAFVRDPKNHSFRTVVTRPDEQPVPIPSTNVKLVVDPVPLTGIFSDRDLHHDTLPGLVGLPLQRQRLQRRTNWQAKPDQETPEYRLPPSVPTVVGYRALMLSEKRLGQMLPAKYDKEAAAAEVGPVSEKGRKAHLLWKERFNMLFAFPRYMATTTPFFDGSDFFLSDQSVFLDPDEIRQADCDADDDAAGGENARRKSPTKYRPATGKQLLRQRRTRPVQVEVSDSDTENSEESEDESGETSDSSTELNVAKTADVSADALDDHGDDDEGDVDGGDDDESDDDEGDDDASEDDGGDVDGGDVEGTPCLTSLKAVSTTVSRLEDMPSVPTNILSSVEASTLASTAASTETPSPVEASTELSGKRKRHTSSKEEKRKKKKTNPPKIMSHNITSPKENVRRSQRVNTSQLRVRATK